MPHPADFTDAHRRHWKDAELLFEDEHWANADHLYGFSAECGLKAVMVGLKMPVNSRGTPRNDEHRKHLPVLWSVFESFARKHEGETYLVLLPNDKPFADWSIDDRYANRCHFRRANVAPHQSAAGQVRRVVERAELDGII